MCLNIIVTSPCTLVEGFRLHSPMKVQIFALTGRQLNITPKSSLHKKLEVWKFKKYVHFYIARPQNAFRLGNSHI